MNGDQIATIIVGGLSLVGTLAGTFGGIMASSRLTGYRIEQLEKKVEAYTGNHNDITARVIKLEDNDKLFDEKLKVCNHRIEDLERKGE